MGPSGNQICAFCFFGTMPLEPALPAEPAIPRIDVALRDYHLLTLLQRRKSWEIAASPRVSNKLRTDVKKRISPTTTHTIVYLQSPFFHFLMNYIISYSLIYSITTQSAVTTGQAFCCVYSGDSVMKGKNREYGIGLIEVLKSLLPECSSDNSERTE